MASEFEKLASYIAARIIDSPGAFENILASGINYKDWPDRFLAKKVISDFERELVNGETSAIWHSVRNLYPESLADIFGETDYPSDQRTIKAHYDKLLYNEKAEELSVKIQNNPSQAAVFVHEFLDYKASSVEVVDFHEAIGDMVLSHEKKKAEGKQLVTIDNWPLLSDAIGGFNPGRLGMLVADTGFGKTNLGIQLAIDASEKMPTLYINMEMIKDDFTQRAVSCMEGMRPKDFHGDWNVEKAKLRAKSRKFFYSTGRDLSMVEITAACRAYKRKHGIEFIVVDYDQKIKLQDSKLEEWRELHKSVVGLETIAKELECYVLVMAQSNLDGGISGSKRSSFPANQVFMFEKNKENDAETIIRASKNRFGIKNASVTCEYDPAKAMVREKEKFVWTQSKKPKKEFKKSSEKEPSMAYEC